MDVMRYKQERVEEQILTDSSGQALEAVILMLGGLTGRPHGPTDEVILPLSLLPRMWVCAEGRSM